MARYGYSRVSTGHQKTDRQDDVFLKMGIEEQNIFTESASGKDRARPILAELMETVKEGDEVVVESISRLARSLHDLISLVDDFKHKNVSVTFLKEGITTSNLNPSGTLILNIFASLAQFEREIMLERQAEGIKAARAKGKQFGRSPIDKPKNFNEVMELVEQGEITAKEAQKILKLKHNKYYELRREYRKEKNAWIKEKLLSEPHLNSIYNGKYTKK